MAHPRIFPEGDIVAPKTRACLQLSCFVQVMTRANRTEDYTFALANTVIDNGLARFLGGLCFARRAKFLTRNASLPRTAMMKKFRPYLVLVVPIAVLSGGVNAGAPIDACAMLTAPQVSSALGTDVGSGQAIMPNNTAVCTWSEQGVPAGTERNVTVSVMTAKSFENGKTPMTGITKTAVTGVGDDAYFVESKGMIAGLSVRKGDNAFQVRARSNGKSFRTGKTPESEEKDKSVERALALEILKKV